LFMLIRETSVPKKQKALKINNFVWLSTYYHTDELHSMEDQPLRIGQIGPWEAWQNLSSLAGKGLKMVLMRTSDNKYSRCRPLPIRTETAIYRTIIFQ
jgi:hypothetical protein